MAVSTPREATGVFPSDIIVQSVIADGLAELRRRPDMLAHVFRGIAQDEPTAALYGQAEADRGPEWFLRTDVPVVIADGDVPPAATCITIAIQNWREDADTLGEIHHETSEPDDARWRPLTSRFTPTSYTQATGAVLLPESVQGQLVVVPGMVLRARDGREHRIVDVSSREQVFITAGTAADLLDCAIYGERPTRRAKLESQVDEETYSIGVWAHGKWVYLSYLYAIVRYVLLRGRKRFEARGIDTVTYGGGGPERDHEEGDGIERLWHRFVTMTGRVRHVWVEDEVENVQWVEMETRASPLGEDDPVVDLDVDSLTQQVEE